MFVLPELAPSHRDLERLQMRFRVGGTIVHGNFNLPKIGVVCLCDASSERSLPSLLEKPVDLECGTGSVVNLRFHSFHLWGCLCHVIMEIVDFIVIIASSFPTLSAFSASESGLLLGELFLFAPENVFFFLSHGFFERRI